MSDSVKRLRQHTVYSNDFVRVRDDEVVLPDGQSRHQLHIEHTEAGPPVVLVVRDGSDFALVRTFRYPLNSMQWAFPRGFSHGPDLRRSVDQELHEELGLAARATQLLGYVTPDSGLLAVRAAVVLVIPKNRAGVPTDRLEVIDVEWLAASEIDARIAAGTLEDGFTLSAWTLARVHGVIP